MTSRSTLEILCTALDFSGQARIHALHSSCLLARNQKTSTKTWVMAAQNTYQLIVRGAETLLHVNRPYARH